MKILAILGSPRKQNTFSMVKTLLDSASGDSEAIILAENDIEPCKDCRICHGDHDCAVKDSMTEIYDKMKNADVIILASPTYFHNVSGLMKNFMDRCLPFYFSRELEGKGAVLLTSGNFGDQLEFDESGKCKWHKEEKGSVKKCLKSMAYFCEILGLKVVSTSYALHDNWKGVEKKLAELGIELKADYEK